MKRVAALRCMLVSIAVGCAMIVALPRGVVGRLASALSGVRAVAQSGVSSPSALASSGDVQPDPAELDFQKRCHAPGVVRCIGFDSPKDFIPAVWPDSGLYPSGDGHIRGTMDRNVKASGNGSLRFEIPSFSPANVSGAWRQAMGKSFGEGSTFFVQFRQRFSREMLTNHWGEGISWKQVIFHGPDATCGDVELTTANYYNAGIPIMYTDCGNRGLYTNGGRPPCLLQQGDYSCPYGHMDHSECFYYPSGQWTTFYYQVSIGHWGKADSTVKAWVAQNGKPYKQWINMEHFILHNQAPGKNDYGYVTLLPYMTDKNMKVNGGPTAYTWYDELIVSTQPIVAPMEGMRPQSGKK